MQDDELTEFEVLRAKSVANTEVTPRDMLRVVLRDIEEGRLDADGVALIFVKRHPGVTSGYQFYRAGMTREQEVLAYDIAHAYHRSRL